jgi:hypothetical protein
MRAFLLLCFSSLLWFAAAQEEEEAEVEEEAAPEAEEAAGSAEEQAAELLQKLDQLNALLKERKEKGFPPDEKLEGAVEKLHQMLGLDGSEGDAKPKRPSMADALPIGSGMLQMFGIVGLGALFAGLGVGIFLLTRPAQSSKKAKKK